MTKFLILKFIPLSYKAPCKNCWDIRTCIHPAHLPLSVYCFLSKLFSRKYVVPSNSRKTNISPFMASFISQVTNIWIFHKCFLYGLLLLVDDNSSFWIFCLDLSSMFRKRAICQWFVLHFFYFFWYLFFS